MNAYELADFVEISKPDDKAHITIATMLRQQADRIAELEKEVKRLVGAEPITHGKLTFCENCGQQDPYAQTKPLSDEEIKELSELTSDPDPTSFVRAIEERHGIK